MRERLHIEPGYRDLFPFLDEAHPFESISEYFGYKLGKDQRRRAKVTRKVLQGPDGSEVPVYFKLYGYRRLRRALSRVLKPTRSKSEFANLKYFHELGIPACEVIIQGEYRNVLGVPRNCMLITKEVEATEQLDVFIDSLGKSDLGDDDQAAIRTRIMELLAGYTRKMHDNGFYHDDLKWRNILVRCDLTESPCLPEVFFIDCPNGYRAKQGSVRARHGKIKDLATLDHLAWRNCSDEERFYFLSCYSGMAIDDPGLKSLGRQVVDYRMRRLDD